MSTTKDMQRPARYCSAHHDPSNALPFNAVASLSVLARSPLNAPILCTLRRSAGIRNEPQIFEDDDARGESPPARAPSALPPPGQLSLSLELHRRLGHGRAGEVYEVSIDLNGSSPELATLAVPPLVAKVSRPGCSTRIQHEAYYYEEMESLQGVIIPRCYGLFTGDIPAGSSLSESAKKPSDELSHGDNPRDSNLNDTNDGSIDSRNQRACSMKSCPDGPTPISILLLERLGDRLPVGGELPADIEEEVLDMYAHLSQLGVDHVDIRHANILEAPVCPPGWPSLISPLMGYPFRFRLIDFDGSRKTNRSIPSFDDYYWGYVIRLLDGLKLGYIVEPWEL